MRSMAEGARALSQVSLLHAPSTMRNPSRERIHVLPCCTICAEAESKAVPATRSAPGLANHHARKKIAASRKRKGGGAPKGACHPLSALHRQHRCNRHRRGRAPNGARSPSGASPRTRHASRNQHWRSPRPCFLGPSLRRVSPAFACPSPARSAQTVFCRTNGDQSRPGTGVY